MTIDRPRCCWEAFDNARVPDIYRPMIRHFSGDTLVIASHNRGKVDEIAELLRDYVRHFPTAADYDLSDPEETGTTFKANAELKARYVAGLVGLPALGDDSGLDVSALDGRPGIHTARFATKPDGSRDFYWAMDRLNEMLDTGGHTDRSARFVCALSLAWPDGHCETVEGFAAGTLTWPPRGDHGFGFDPVFVPDGRTQTFAEIAPETKHRISHRADAFQRLVARCFAT